MKIIPNMFMLLALFFVVVQPAYADGSERTDRKMPARPDFSLLDTDSNEEIDLYEFSLQTLPHGDHETVFSDIDTNSDDVITLQEYQNHKPPHPKKH